MIDVKAAALGAHEAGLCVVPPLDDGSKAPDGTWKQFQVRRPSAGQIDDWYADGRTGVGVICGAVSGGLEMLEFEGRAVAEGVQGRYRDLAEAAGLGAVLSRILTGYAEDTPTGGLHLLYRVPTPLGNTKLASRPATARELDAKPQDRIKVLMETRGEGGYVIVAPSNGHVHPSGGAWKLVSGGFDRIATITDAERDELFRLARMLDTMPVEPPRDPGTTAVGDRPGDRYNAAPDVQDRILAVLLDHGWTKVWQKSETVYLRRPGKERSVSATLGHIAPGVLRVFSTSTVFEARAYDPFGVYAILEHEGDFVAAAAALKEEDPVTFSATARALGPTITGTAPAPTTDPRLGERATERPAEPPAHLVRQSLAAWHFAQMAGERVRFDHGRGRWLIWSGHRWRPDEDGSVKRLWLDALATRYRRALEADDRERVRLTTEVQAAGALNSAIAAGLDIASNMKPIATTADAWDPDLWVLGCENGVIELRTGHLRPGRPEEMISRSTGIEYDPDAPCPRWTQFLQEVFAGDEELVAWYGLLVGTSLVGVVQELLAIHHGLGNNGKSVAVRALRHAIGDYAVVIPVETLVNAKRAAGEATPDLMALRGARIAFTSEPDQTAKLRGGVLKRLASVDMMTGRPLYGGTATWEPTHTVHLATNHLPTVDDATEGFWRRVALVPWNERFRKPGEDGDAPPEDPELAATLAREGPGILAWAVRGAVAHAAGQSLFPFPTAVRVRTDAYRANEDKLGGFIVERVVYERDASVAVGVLFAAYQDWCKRESVTTFERLGRDRFASGFEERGRGVKRGRDATNRAVLTGARLRLSTDPESSESLTPFAGTPHTRGDIEKSGNSLQDSEDSGTPPEPRAQQACVARDEIGR